MLEVGGTGAASRVDPGGRSERQGGRRDRASCGLEKQAKVFRHVLGGGIPIRRPLHHCLQTDAFQFLGDRVVDLPGWARLGRLSHLLDDLWE